MLRGVVADGVFVSAENINGIAADAQARAGNQAVIDCVADGCVGGAGAFGAHVALGSKSGKKIVARGNRGENRALRDGFLHGLQIFGAGMQEKVDVRVDEAGEESGVAEVDEFGLVWAGHMRADFHDEAALHQNFAGGRDASSFYVEQARGVQHDCLRLRRGGARVICLRINWRSEKQRGQTSCS